MMEEEYEAYDTKATHFRAAYKNDGYDDGLGVHKIDTAFYKSVQMFKNHKLQVTFKPGCAEIIAKALLRDFYKVEAT